MVIVFYPISEKVMKLITALQLGRVGPPGNPWRHLQLRRAVINEIAGAVRRSAAPESTTSCADAPPEMWGSSPGWPRTDDLDVA
jgi:hypothetical protein